MSAFSVSYVVLTIFIQISAVRLPREPSNPERLKGFGYAEFDDVDSLLRALSLNEEVRRCNKNLFLYFECTAFPVVVLHSQILGYLQ